MRIATCCCGVNKKQEQGETTVLNKKLIDSEVKDGKVHKTQIYAEIHNLVHSSTCFRTTEAELRVRE